MAEINPTAMGGKSAEDFATVLQEAELIKGVSLWQDAWKRLRKNWSAMMSLYFLLGISLLALLTPLLPIQSPLDKDLEHRITLSPGFDAVQIGSRDELRFKNNSLVEELAEFDKELDKLNSQLRASSPDNRGEIENKIEKHRGTDPLRKLWNNPGGLTSAMIRMRLAIFGDWCVPSLFGTDALGRDVLSRVCWGSRISLIVGIVATLVSLVIGVSYGATAGYIGGTVDSIMMRIVDVIYSIPFIFVVIFLITILSEPSIKEKYLDPYGINQIMIFYVVIGAIYWLTMARVVRGQVISLKNEQFVDAAKTTGASQTRIIFRHLVPNVMGVVIVYLTLTIPAVMRFEAFLSFLGLGVSPPDVSWGLLVNEGILVITPIRVYWWLVLFPGLALALTLFALNFLGDGVRDALDPRMKNREV